MNVRLRVFEFALMPLGVALALILYGPVAQLAGYHDFADRRSLMGIVNFADTVSNIPFFLVGAIGLLHWLRARRGSIAWLAVFVGAVLVCIGSWHYHQNPNDRTLVWDRLPIALTFMAFLVAVLEDHLGGRTAAVFLLPSLLVGAAGVFYWRETGDLRLYLWTQIVPLLAVPACIGLFRGRFTHRNWYWAVFASYVLAKAAELGDAPIFALTHGAISGHTLKHLLAALGLVFIILMVIQRRTEHVR